MYCCLFTTNFSTCFGHSTIIPVQVKAYRSFPTTVSQLQICDFLGETFKRFEVLLLSMCAMTTKMLSSSTFCNLCYDTIAGKSASANVSFYTNSKMPFFELWHIRVATEQYDV